MTTSTAHAPTVAATVLPAWRRPLVVVAHPDDESFGLGGLLSTFVDAGSEPTVLCFTHGEASTLHGVEGDLRTIRADELVAAAAALEVRNVELMDEPDGDLGSTDWDMVRLGATIEHIARHRASDGLLTFDLGGVTSHRDHDIAARAAILAAEELDLEVLGWTLPSDVALTLNVEQGTTFIGRAAAEIDMVVDVQRDRQLRAVEAHPSQAVPGSALWRRLELLGNREHLRWLRRRVHGVAAPVR